MRAARDPVAFVIALDGEGCGDGDRSRGLGGGHAVDGDPPGADQLGGLLPGARETAPHQLGVNTSAPRHVRLALLDRFQRTHQQVVGFLEPCGDSVDVGFGEFVEDGALLGRVRHICQ